MKHRAFTLIEAVMCVIVLGLAVPPALELMQSASAHRADAVNTGRATILAGLVLETVIADVCSEADGLGFAALDDLDTYLNAPDSGLYTRLEAAATPYEAVGMSFTVVVSDPICADGTVASDATQNLFRLVTVTVQYPSSDGVNWELPVFMMVGDL